MFSGSSGFRGNKTSKENEKTRNFPEADATLLPLPVPVPLPLLLLLNARAPPT